MRTPDRSLLTLLTSFASSRSGTAHSGSGALTASRDRRNSTVGEVRRVKAMWKPGSESGQEILRTDSMEVVPSSSPTNGRSEESLDVISQHSLAYDDAIGPDGSSSLNLPSCSSPSTSTHFPPSDGSELRQKSSPNILSWVAEQRQITMRMNNSVATRRPQSVQDGKRPDPAEYETAAKEIRRIRRQCGM